MTKCNIRAMLNDVCDSKSNRGYKMRAHVLLVLLNELRKRHKYEACRALYRFQKSILFKKRVLSVVFMHLKCM